MERCPRCPMALICSGVKRYSQTVWQLPSRGEPKSAGKGQLWVTSCLSDCVGTTAAVPRIAADLLQRPRRQPRARKRHFRPLSEGAGNWCKVWSADMPKAGGIKGSADGRDRFFATDLECGYISAPGGRP